MMCIVITLLKKLSRVCICVSERGKQHEVLNSACQQGIVQAGVSSVIVGDMFIWRFTRFLVKLESVDFVADHLHIFMSAIFPCAQQAFQQDKAHLANIREQH